MQGLLNTAVQAARKAGDIAIRYMNRLDDIDVRSKARNEFVTLVDHAAERAIIETIRARYPDHGFIAEESGRHAGSECVWIIDPLDGTTNFIHGFPVFSVSIALRVRDQLEVAVVYDPCRQELYTGIRGSGAQLDGRRIRASKQIGLEGALIGTGFPYRSNADWLPRYMPMLQAVMEQTAGVRRPGSAALDLCSVAAGRLDGFFEFGLSIWDIAAGALLIRESGGLIGGLTPDGDFLDTGNVIAATPKVYDALRDLLTPHL
jgi:myo-inositol-1(or 4)-monophosphatase